MTPQRRSESIYVKAASPKPDLLVNYSRVGTVLLSECYRRSVRAVLVVSCCLVKSAQPGTSAQCELESGQAAKPEIRS